jgi:uncharacterized protein involved in tolerance to divalent cations
MEKNFIQVQITFPTEESALSMANRLVERRLAACETSLQKTALHMGETT